MVITGQKTFFQKLLSRLVPVLLAVNPFLFSGTITWLAVKYQLYITDWSPVAWILVFLVVPFALTAGLCPSTFLCLAGGFFLGWWSFAGLLFSYFIAQLLGFALGKFVGTEKVKRWLQHKPAMTGFLQNVSERGILFCALCRLSPALPFAVMNLVLPAVGIKIRPFLLGGTLGMLPRTLLFIAAGRHLQSLAEGRETLNGNQTIEMAALVIISLVGISLFFKKNRF